MSRDLKLLYLNVLLFKDIIRVDFNNKEGIIIARFSPGIGTWITDVVLGGL